jgi:hypothetical protein
MNMFLQLLNKYLFVECLKRENKGISDWAPMWPLQQDIMRGNICIAFNRASEEFLSCKKTAKDYYFGWLLIHNSVRRHPSLLRALEEGLAANSESRTRHLKFWANSMRTEYSIEQLRKGGGV